LQAEPRADDFTYISDEELVAELHRQQEDMDRAKARLASLELDEIDTIAALEQAEKVETQAQQTIKDRIQLIYRLTHTGRIGQYLLGAESTLEIFKRLQTLKHLVIEGLEAYTLTTQKVVQLQDKLSDINREQQQSNKMLAIFEPAFGELRAEQQRRR
jgi:uncharacterized pyridoxal phosphate-containing UPF0001 family protein